MGLALVSFLSTFNYIKIYIWFCLLKGFGLLYIHHIDLSSIQIVPDSFVFGLGKMGFGGAVHRERTPLVWAKLLLLLYNDLLFFSVQVRVLAPGSVQARPFAQPPSTLAEIQSFF